MPSEPEKDDNDEWVKILVEAKHDMPWIIVTDLYMDACNSILVDGIDNEDFSKRCGFIIYPEHYPALCDFINDAIKLEENNPDNLQTGEKTKDEINSTILELASELAEKELVDKHQVLPYDLFEDENYKEEFQDEFNSLFDKYYNRIAGLFGFRM